MTKLSQQDLGNGITVVAEDSGNVVLEVSLATVPERKVLHITVTNVDGMIEALTTAKAIAQINDWRPPAPCGAVYGLGDGQGTATCGRPEGHASVAEDRIGHNPRPLRGEQVAHG